MKYLKKNTLPLITILLFFAALIPRAIELFNNYDYFTHEPAIDYNAARQIVVSHILSSTGYSYGGFVNFPKIAWDLLLAIPFALSGGHPFSLKILMFIISVATVFAGYVVSSKFYNKQTALYVTLFVLSSPILIDYAGQIAPPFVTPLIILFYLLFLFKFFEGNSKYLLGVFFVLGLLLHFEVPVSVFLVIQLIPYILISLLKKLVTLKTIAISFLLGLIVGSPIFVNLLNKPTSLQILSPKHIPTIGFLFQQHLETFLWNFSSSLLPNFYLSSILGVVLCVGSYLYIKNTNINRINRLQVFYLASSPIHLYLISLIFPIPLSGWWFPMLTIFYCYLAGILTSYYIELRRYRLIIILIGMVLLLLFVNRTILRFKSTFSFPPNVNKSIKVVSVISFMYTNASGNNFSYEILPNTGKRYDYEQMLWWIGKNLKTKSRIDANSKLKYVIIYRVGNNKISTANYINLILLKKFPGNISLYRISN